VLRVVSGRAEQDEYDLGAHTSLIGRSDTALVRLRGWFKPSVAVAIARSGNTYIATALGGKPLVNDQRLDGRHDLQDGDVISVSGLVLEFRWKDAERAESAA
jgi:pSer/pThr/pTyr-binding forkhead associated (FHA) protein